MSTSDYRGFCATCQAYHALDVRPDREVDGPRYAEYADWRTDRYVLAHHKLYGTKRVCSGGQQFPAVVIKVTAP